MKKRTLAGVLAFLLVGNLGLILNATGVFRCEWLPACEGDCYCTGDGWEMDGLCMFHCIGGDEGYCGPWTWPWTCNYIDP